MRKFCNDINTDFTCLHCGSFVSSAAFIAGVGNRNHCPYCLWSRHLDLLEAGDRLAACKATMRPLGLTLKRSRNKYASTASGELMLVHECTDCQHLSINRIAADDVPETLIEVFQDSRVLSGRLREQIAQSGINLLGDQSTGLVYQQLYGQISSPAPVTLTSAPACKPP
jgi:hypothetical protein